MAKFILTIHNKGELTRREVKADSFTIGRSLDCEISWSDGNISRHHLQVNHRQDQIWIEDANSSNGTFVNGTKIKPGTLVNIVPSDQVQLGQSDFIFNIDIEVEAPLPSVIPQLPPAFDEDSPLDKTMELQLFGQPQLQAEKILSEAKRKAAQIILEGETQAEKKAQAIHQTAREIQAQAEMFYQARVAESHREADAILTDFQKQGQQLLHDARVMAQELRDDVDVYIQNLKDSAQKNADSLLAEAQASAQKIRDEALAQGREELAREREEIIGSARDEADRISSELKEKRLELEQLEKSLFELEDKNNQEVEALTATEKIISSLSGEKSKAQEALSLLQIQTKNVEEEKNKIELSIKEIQEKQAHLMLDIQNLESKKEKMLAEHEQEKLVLGEKLEKEKAHLAKIEEQRIEDFRLETAKRFQKIERSMLAEILDKKSSLIKEIYSAIEKEVVGSMPPEKWRQISSLVQDHISDVINSKLVSLSQGNGEEKNVKIVSTRKKDRFRGLSLGLAMGVFFYFFGGVVFDKISRNKNPIQRMISSEVKKRQADIESRRFQPKQVDELKDTYTDSVIYTRNYVSFYSNPETQKKFYKEASKYLLKTWRVDEDKSIQVISAAKALVSELADRRAKLHPDFVKEGIEKMRAVEEQSLARMKEILGTQVRLESYLKFEKKFYKKEAQYLSKR